MVLGMAAVPNVRHKGWSTVRTEGPSVDATQHWCESLARGTDMCVGRRLVSASMWSASAGARAGAQP